MYSLYFRGIFVFLYAPSDFEQSLLMKALAETFRRMCFF